MDYILIAITAISLIMLLFLIIDSKKNKTKIETLENALISENQRTGQLLEYTVSQNARIEETIRKQDEQKYQIAGVSNQIIGVVDSCNNLLQVQSAQNAETAREMGHIKGVVNGMKEQFAIQYERMDKSTQDKLASFEIMQKSSISNMTEGVKSSIEKLREVQNETLNATKESTQERLERMDKSTQDKLASFEIMQKSSITNMTESVKSSIEKLREVQKETLNSTKESTKERLESMDAKIQSLSQSLGENIRLLTMRTSENIAKLETTLSASVGNLKANVDENLKYMNKENQKELERMRIIVDEKLTSTLESRLNSSFNVINNSLEQVYKGLGDVQNLTKGVGDLKNVLQNVKTRGTWAEVQLDNLLSQMLTPNQYCKQAVVDKNSNERVDFGILLPGKDQEVIIPIDSKFPIEDYYRLINASEEGDTAMVAQATKKLEDAIKVQAASISQKYVKPPKTTDFAVMYLPLEGLYAEVLRNSSLIESLQRDKRIVVAGPSTLGAILNSLQMGFRTLEIEKRSGEIYDLLAVFKKEFLKFSEILDKTQKKINEASNQIELASRKTRTIGRKLRDVTNENKEISNIEQDLMEIAKGGLDE